MVESFAPASGHRAALPSISMDPNRIVRLGNRECPYCMRRFGRELSKTEDHVIGKRFAPKGLLARGWNLLVLACKRCNEEKAELENDISAITLYQLSFWAAEDQERWPDLSKLKQEVMRKGRARSATTGRRVNESFVNSSTSMNFGPAEMTFGFVGPPQLNADRILRLAGLHVRGLSAIIMQDNETKSIKYQPPVFILAEECSRGDWGNIRAMGFASAVAGWPTRLLAANAAGGYFSAMIRKEPGDRPVWSWALEWNRAYRLMGFMGDDEQYLTELACGLPSKKWSAVRRYTDPTLGRVFERYRTESPLNPAEDILFSD